MFNRAVDIIRTNIPDSFVEKATPYYNRAQGVASDYINQAQSMRNNIVTTATTRVTSFKESSTTYVNGAAERLDDVLIDNGANKISSKYFGREIVHFHFKEALEKLAEKRKQQQEEQEKKAAQDQSAAASDEAKKENDEKKEQAASSIANLFNNLQTSSSVAVKTVTEKISSWRETAQEKINTNKARLPNVEQSRQFAVRSVAGACTLVLNNSKIALQRGSTYLPVKVTTVAQESINTATPYLEKTLGYSRQFDEKFLNGFAFAFVGEVQAQMFPAAATATNEQEDQTSTEETKVVDQQEQQQQQEEEDVPSAEADNEEESTTTTQQE